MYPAIRLTESPESNSHCRDLSSAGHSGISWQATSAAVPFKLAVWILLVLTWLVAFSVVASGQPTWEASGPGTNAPIICVKPNKDIVDKALCLKEKFDKYTPKDGRAGVVVGSIAPGSGFTGGVGYSKTLPTSENWETIFETSARISVKKYWQIETKLRFVWNHLHSNPTRINAYGLVRSMPRLDYFGIGPESREQDRAVFHYDEGVLGVDIVHPPRSWIDIGGATEVILPRIVRITNPTVRSVERVQTEAQAPGITSQPNFLHLAVYAGLHNEHTANKPFFDYRFLYHAFQDLDHGRYSFRRFEADLRNRFPLGSNELRIRGRASFAETSAGNRVPFYLMDTLGGENINQVESLRGFRDYRFRDRDSLLLQTEFLRPLKGPLNLIVFYDTGKVAPSLSRLGDGRLRHTYGIGFVVLPRATENLLARFYFAFGSGEGSRTYLGLVDLFGGRPDRVVR